MSFKYLASLCFDIYFFLNFLTVSCWESCGEALVRKEQAYFPCFEMGGKLCFSFSLCVYTLILDGPINYVYGTPLAINLDCLDPRGAYRFTF